jgi:hypothetical protein
VDGQRWWRHPRFFQPGLRGDEAEIQSDGIKYRLGTFDSIEGAIIAREIKEIELFGEFARLNFPKKVLIRGSYAQTN